MRMQHLVRRAFGAGKVDEERSPQIGRESLVPIKTGDVEQVPRLLTVERSDDLATKEVLERHDSHFHESERLSNQRAGETQLRDRYRSTHYGRHVDLDRSVAAFDSNA